MGSCCSIPRPAPVTPDGVQPRNVTFDHVLNLGTQLLSAVPFGAGPVVASFVNGARALCANASRGRANAQQLQNLLDEIDVDVIKGSYEQGNKTVRTLIGHIHNAVDLLKKMSNDVDFWTTDEAQFRDLYNDIQNCIMRLGVLCQRREKRGERRPPGLDMKTRANYAEAYDRLLMVYQRCGWRQPETTLNGHLNSLRGADISNNERFTEVVARVKQNLPNKEQLINIQDDLMAKGWTLDKTILEQGNGFKRPFAEELVKTALSPITISIHEVPELPPPPPPAFKVRTGV